MSTYQSIGASAALAALSSGSFTITKPTGLAVGDIMIACIYGRVDGTYTSLTPGETWTLIGTTGTNPRGHLYYKIADADDVAASTFSFSASTGSTNNTFGGFIVRASSFGLLDSNSQSSGTITGAATTTTTTGFTPSRANTLFIAFVGFGRLATIPALDVTSVSMATSNPTWTERAQLNRDTSSNTHVIACYTATRAEVTATGTLTAGFPAPGSDCEGVFLVVALTPRIDGSITVGAQKVAAYSFSPVQSAEVEASADGVTEDVSYPTRWDTVDKS